MSKKTLNKNLHKAKNAKKDEFYTQLPDIEKEMKGVGWCLLGVARVLSWSLLEGRLPVPQYELTVCGN